MILIHHQPQTPSTPAYAVFKHRTGFLEIVVRQGKISLLEGRTCRVPSSPADWWVIATPEDGDDSLRYDEINIVYPQDATSDDDLLEQIVEHVVDDNEILERIIADPYCLLMEVKL